MCQPTTLPFEQTSENHRPWQPSSRDRLIFQWVKFDGQRQSWVAQQFDIHQSTVSRIVERYERWIAHGGPAQQGALSRDERLRSERWLAYERNEHILTSALRIAGEMEQAIDTSKSVITKSSLSSTHENQVRTEHKVLDRSGIAARFLRLAFRVNVEQLKLLEQEPLPALEPLSFDDLSDENVVPSPREGQEAEHAPDDFFAPEPDNSAYAHSPSQETTHEPPAESKTSFPAPNEPGNADPPAAPSPTMQPPHICADLEPTLNAFHSNGCDNIRPQKKPRPAAYPVASTPPKRVLADPCQLDVHPASAHADHFCELY